MKSAGQLLRKTPGPCWMLSSFRTGMLLTFKWLVSSPWNCIPLWKAHCAPEHHSPFYLHKGTLCFPEWTQQSSEWKWGVSVTHLLWPPFIEINMTESPVDETNDCFTLLSPESLTESVDKLGLEPLSHGGQAVLLYLSRVSWFLVLLLCPLICTVPAVISKREVVS